ncbi:low-density lipoprotein receptor-related protein 8, partial [Maylandia zebra]|uniref:low-density lipoprotein receptor-related protein 8 n=1 Tax=Maylandia zebra TaxID=106582 RepID=UPI00403D2D3D
YKDEAVTHDVLSQSHVAEDQKNGQFGDRHGDSEEVVFLEPFSTVHSIILDWTSATFIDSVGAKAIRQIIKEHAAVDVRVVIAGCNRKSPYLLFTNRHEIRRIHLLKSEYTQVVPTLKNAVALDVDVSTNKMFWCDLYHQKIYSAYINKASDSSQQVTLIDSLHSPEGLAVDWVHKNIYWTDSGNKSISVATGDGRKRKMLITTELNEPRAIAVDPHQGFMYWSDWGGQAKIEKAGMNGVDRQILVSEHIEWPNGITLDLSNRRLYWVDSKLHLLSSVDFNGDNRKVLLSSISISISNTSFYRMKKVKAVACVSCLKFSRTVGVF